MKFFYRSLLTVIVACVCIIASIGLYFDAITPYHMTIQAPSWIFTLVTLAVAVGVATIILYGWCVDNICNCCNCRNS